MKRFTSRDLQSPYQRMLGPGPTYQPRGVRRTSANGFGTMQIMHRRQEVKNMTEVREECASADLAQIYEDIEILHQQQEEAEKRLTLAKGDKMRGCIVLNKLETRLQELKYRNGQKRALMHRLKELLSNGQQALAVEKDSSAKARSDLCDLDRAVRRAVETNRSRLVWERTCDRLLAAVKIKCNVCKDNAHATRVEVTTLEETLHAVLRDEELLKRAVQKLYQDIRATANEISKIRSESTVVESQIDITSKSRHNLRQEATTWKQQAKEARDDWEKIKEEIEINLSHLQDELVEHQKQVGDKETALKDATTTLHSSWEHVIAIQKREGHPESQHPSVSNDPASLDLVRLEESIKAEALAAANEEITKLELLSQVESLQKEYEQVKDQLLDKQKYVENLKQKYEEHLLQETNRKIDCDALAKSYAHVSIEVEQARLVVERLRERRDCDVLDEKEKRHVAETTCGEKKAALASILKKIDRIRTSLQLEEKALESCVRNNHELTLVDMRNTIVDLEIVIVAMETEMQQSATEEPGAIATEAAQRVMKEGEMKVKIAKMINAYPALDMITFIHDSNKTLQQQKKDCLRDLRKHCKKRIQSAEKMAKELRDASEREKAERATLLRAAVEERERKDNERKKRARSLEKIDTKADVRKNDSVFRRDEGALHRDSASDAKPRDLIQSFNKVATVPFDYDQKQVHWNDVPRINDSKVWSSHHSHTHFSKSSPTDFSREDEDQNRSLHPSSAHSNSNQRYRHLGSETSGSVPPSAKNEDGDYKRPHSSDHMPPQKDRPKGVSYSFNPGRALIKPSEMNHKSSAPSEKDVDCRQEFEQSKQESLRNPVGTIKTTHIRIGSGSNSGKRRALGTKAMNSTRLVSKGNPSKMLASNMPKKERSNPKQTSSRTAPTVKFPNKRLHEETKPRSYHVAQGLGRPKKNRRREEANFTSKNKIASFTPRYKGFLDD